MQCRYLSEGIGASILWGFCAVSLIYRESSVIFDWDISIMCSSPYANSAVKSSLSLNNCVKLASFFFLIYFGWKLFWSLYLAVKLQYLCRSLMLQMISGAFTRNLGHLCMCTLTILFWYARSAFLPFHSGSRYCDETIFLENWTRTECNVIKIRSSAILQISCSYFFF